MISPGLYTIYSERIMLCVVEEHHDGITIGGRKDTNLRCADDTTLLCTCNDEFMAVHKGSETKEDFIPDDEKIE